MKINLHFRRIFLIKQEKLKEIKAFLIQNKKIQLYLKNLIQKTMDKSILDDLIFFCENKISFFLLKALQKGFLYTIWSLFKYFSSEQFLNKTFFCLLVLSSEYMMLFFCYMFWEHHKKGENIFPYICVIKSIPHISMVF